MNFDKFKSLVQEVFQEVERKLLGDKHKEYSSKADMFVNFKEAAEVLDIAPEVVCYHYSTKHYISIMDLFKKQFKVINGIVLKVKDYPKEFIKEKITDMIGYLILLYGILNDSE